MDQLNNAQQAHFIGIGGIGVSAVAKMMLHRGVSVTGSDAVKSEITEELEQRGIKIFYAHSAENLPENLDLLIYSAAVPEDNPERAEARKRGIKEMSYFDFLGELSRDYYTIAVSGTNGKSTTTAMIGLILEEAGLDPTVIVGSKVKTFPDGNLRLGKSKYFVVEACEYQAHMLKIHPQMIVLTNIEEDHLDYYRDLNHIKETFKEYVRKLPADGKLIYNSDDEASYCLSNVEYRISNPATSYGINTPADYLAKNILVDSGRQYFSMLRANPHEEILGNFSLQVPGRFNVYNALAAATAAFSLGIDADAAKKALGQFTGIWRRFEKVGKHHGAIIVSDYGHHPTAIRETVRAAREFYPNRRIVLLFQPHQRNRTRKLWAEFRQSLQTPDVLILSEIYDVTGREAREDKKVSSKPLFDEIQEVHKNAYFAANLDEAETRVRKIARPNDLIIIMGAGDIDKVARNLTK